MRISTIYVDNEHDFEGDIITYVNNLSLADSIKQEILSKDFISEVLPIYTKYSSLFNRSFSVNQNTELLNIAGFLYHRSIIYLDKLIDRSSSNAKLVLLASICQEESIKILSSIFHLNSSFWRTWNIRRNEYLNGIHVDFISQNVYTFEDFEKLADHKSAFGKISIDALYLLSDLKDLNLYNFLILSHKYFYCGLQILDDINDLREDIANKQFNFAYYHLKKDIHARNQSIDSYTIDEQISIFYIYGTADKLFINAVEYLDKAIDVVRHLSNLEDWIFEISKVKNLAITKKLNVKAFLAVSNSKLVLSNDKVSENDISLSIYSGSKYIKKIQNNDGSWNEYFNEAGTSDTWVTAFVLYFLSQSKEIQAIFENEIARGFKFIENFNNHGQWGYNKEWIPDGDSTAFVCLSMLMHEKEVNKESFNALFKYQKGDGGFSTYNNAQSILASLNWNVKEEKLVGWLSSHFCVSSVIYYLLLKGSQKSSQFKMLEKYILNKISNSNSRNPYWWTSQIYPISFLIKSFPLTSDFDIKRIIKELTESVISSQSQNGSFFNDSSFYTGLVIDCICDVPQFFVSYKKEIFKAITWLKENQKSNGSWESSHAMCIPSPDVVNPIASTHWPIDNKGINIRAQEFNRLFSTVVPLTAIIKFNSIQANNE